MKNNGKLSFLTLVILCIVGITVPVVIAVILCTHMIGITASAPGVDESIQMVKIVQAQRPPPYADVDGISRPAVLKAHKSNFIYPSATSVRRFSVIEESTFDEETVRQFAENLRESGAFTDYSIERVYGGYRITNASLADSCGVFQLIDGGDSAIWEAVMQDSGLGAWLDAEGLRLEPTGVLGTTYQLLLSGMQSLDYINIELENFTLIGCTMSIHDYSDSEEHYELLPLEDALKNAVFWDHDGQISEKEIHVYGTTLVYADSLPVYFLSAYALKEAGQTNGTHYIGLAIPFFIETEDELEAVRTVLRRLPELDRLT